MHSKRQRRRRGWQLWQGDMRRPSAAPDLGPERNARLPRPAPIVPPFPLHAMRRLSASCLCSLGCCLSFPFCNGAAACWMSLEFATVAEVIATVNEVWRGGVARQGRQLRLRKSCQFKWVRSAVSTWVAFWHLSSWHAACGMQHVACRLLCCTCCTLLTADCMTTVLVRPDALHLSTTSGGLH